VTSSGAIADAMNSIAVIRDDISEAIGSFTKQVAVKTSPLSELETTGLIARLDAYAANLKVVAEAAPAGIKAQMSLAKKLLLYSYEARICAVVRALARCEGKDKKTLASIITLAEALTVWKPLYEAVTVIWVDKDKGGYRPLVISGPMRTAQCLMVRDMLLMMGIDSQIDFTKKGAGGEKQLVMNVCNDIEEGVNWWWMPDIKQCFTCITPSHFGWLPIDRRLLKNVMFLPKCAKIVVRKHKTPGLVLQSLAHSHSDFSVNDSYTSLESLSVQIVRQGLPQGSVLSPLLARAVISRLIETALPCAEISQYAFSDDLNFGACTKGEISAAKQAVTEVFSSLPAGHIELHDAPVVNALSRRVEVLGYRLEPGNGQGDSFVHVKPSRKRTERFKRKLAEKLKKAAADANRFDVAEKYRTQWFKSMHAWTKVPLQSDDVSRCITMSYVDDFIHGLPMGVWKANTPMLKAIGTDVPK
jgi:hypothetical protein